MDNKDRMNVRVQVAGTFYTMRNVPRRDEEKYRRAAELVNTLVTNYKSQFNGMTHENHLAMAALHVCMENIDWMMKGDVENSTVAELVELEKNLDDYIVTIKK